MVDAPNWERFAQGVAAGIARGCVDDAVILAWSERGFVQYMQEAGSITVQVSDPDVAPLSEQQRHTLASDGWDPPGSDFGPLWTREVRWRPDPVLFDEFAQMITVVLRDVIALPSPAQLRVEAFNVIGGERFELPFTGVEYDKAVLDAQLRLADLRLHESAAAFLIGRQGLDAQTVAVVARAAGRRPTRTDAGEYFVDRVLYVDGDDPHLLVWSHVGPSGRTGSRLVPPHPPVDGPFIRAEQGSAVYVRDLLQRNKSFAAALRANPALHERVRALLGTGRADVVRAACVGVDSTGAVTVTAMKLAPHEIDVPTLRLAA
ncbi:TY-Chap domain-containing protein [Couchioplanes azureus]|uniref:TY-Chap domain-containing protein n=1 Tax=Couchioplanes caeruleus TaxID=56438 RepID=UPI0019A9BE80|nr:hypothetical protein GCM10010166_63960 [Couchioplanes caeruleus subsp. azureus]